MASGGGGGLPLAAIISIAVGGAVLVSVIAGVALYLRLRNRDHGQSHVPVAERPLRTLQKTRQSKVTSPLPLSVPTMAAAAAATAQEKRRKSRSKRDRMSKRLNFLGQQVDHSDSEDSLTSLGTQKMMSFSAEQPSPNRHGGPEATELSGGHQVFAAQRGSSPGRKQPDKAATALPLGSIDAGTASKRASLMPGLKDYIRSYSIDEADGIAPVVVRPESIAISGMTHTGFSNWSMPSPYNERNNSLSHKRNQSISSVLSRDSGMAPAQALPPLPPVIYNNTDSPARKPSLAILGKTKTASSGTLPMVASPTGSVDSSHSSILGPKVLQKGARRHSRKKSRDQSYGPGISAPFQAISATSSTSVSPSIFEDNHPAWESSPSFGLTTPSRSERFGSQASALDSRKASEASVYSQNGVDTGKRKSTGRRFLRGGSISTLGGSFSSQGGVHARQKSADSGSSLGYNGVLNEYSGKDTAEQEPEIQVLPAWPPPLRLSKRSSNDPTSNTDHRSRSSPELFRNDSIVDPALSMVPTNTLSSTTPRKSILVNRGATANAPATPRRKGSVTIAAGGDVIWPSSPGTLPNEDSERREAEALKRFNARRSRSISSELLSFGITVPDEVHDAEESPSPPPVPQRLQWPRPGDRRKGSSSSISAAGSNSRRSRPQESALKVLRSTVLAAPLIATDDSPFTLPKSHGSSQPMVQNQPIVNEVQQQQEQRDLPTRADPTLVEPVPVRPRKDSVAALRAQAAAAAPQLEDAFASFPPVPQLLSPRSSSSSKERMQKQPLRQQQQQQQQASFRNSQSTRSSKASYDQRPLPDLPLFSGSRPTSNEQYALTVARDAASEQLPKRKSQESAVEDDTYRASEAKKALRRLEGRLSSNPSPKPVHTSLASIRAQLHDLPPAPEPQAATLHNAGSSSDEGPTRSTNSRAMNDVLTSSMDPVARAENRRKLRQDLAEARKAAAALTVSISNAQAVANRTSLISTSETAPAKSVTREPPPPLPVMPAHFRESLLSPTSINTHSSRDLSCRDGLQQDDLASPPPSATHQPHNMASPNRDSYYPPYSSLQINHFSTSAVAPPSRLNNNQNPNINNPTTSVAPFRTSAIPVPARSISSGTGSRTKFQPRDRADSIGRMVDRREAKLVEIRRPSGSSLGNSNAGSVRNSPPLMAVSHLVR